MRQKEITGKVFPRVFRGEFWNLFINHEQAQDPTARIECYACEYRISDRGDESGAYCLSVNENTPKKSYELNKVHNHHGPGINTKSRLDRTTHRTNTE